MHMQNSHILCAQFVDANCRAYLVWIFIHKQTTDLFCFGKDFLIKTWLDRTAERYCRNHRNLAIQGTDHRTSVVLYITVYSSETSVHKLWYSEFVQWYLYTDCTHILNLLRNRRFLMISTQPFFQCPTPDQLLDLLYGQLLFSFFWLERQWEKVH